MSLKLNIHLQKGDFTLQADLELPGDRLVAISGPSGCGKSTLVRAIAGLERAEGNQVSFNDNIWQKDGFWQPPHLRGVAMVFQKPALFTHLNVEKNLRYGWKRRDNNRPGLSIHEAAELLEITGMLKRDTFSLSGGEAQRVAIARALVSNPSLLIMDEPLSALDEQSKQKILPYLEQIHRSLQLPVLYISHALEELARLADHILLMENGTVLHSAPAQIILSDPECGLALHRHAQTIFEGEILSYDPASEICTLNTEAGKLYLTSDPIMDGIKVRVRIKARDISISLHQLEDTSVLNFLPATVKSITSIPGGQCLVSLEAGDAPLLSRISRHSAQRLKLRRGLKVFAQIKSAALLGGTR